MILVAGLSPAWQQIYRFDELHPGKVNRAAECLSCPSGKVLNVGLVLHHLGVRCLTLSLAGGTTGIAIREAFAELNCPARWIPCAASTRVCTTVLDGRTGETTELVGNSAPIADDERNRFAEAFREELPRADTVVLTGSLPAGASAAWLAELVAEAAARSRVILDMRGAELLAALPHRPWLVKPNRDELAQTLRRRLDDDEDLQKAIDELHARGAQRVLITQGGRPAWFSDGEATAWCHPAAVPVVNPIGCGDALTAGIAARSLADAGGGGFDVLRYGMACAAVRAAQLHPWRIDPQQVEAVHGTLEIRPRPR